MIAKRMVNSIFFIVIKIFDFTIVVNFCAEQVFSAGYIIF